MAAVSITADAQIPGGISMATADDILAASKILSSVESQFRPLGNPQLTRSLQAAQLHLASHLPPRERKPA